MNRLWIFPNGKNKKMTETPVSILKYAFSGKPSFLVIKNLIYEHHAAPMIL